MLTRLFRRSLQALHKPVQVREKSFLFICATRKPHEEFWADSATGRSLRLLQKSSRRSLRWDIAYSNTQGLPSIYNEAFRRAGDADIVLFVHDDIWFSPGLLEAVQEGLGEFHVIGVVGNTRCLPGQPSWLFRELDGQGRLVQDDMCYLSGASRHGNPDDFEVDDSNRSRNACELLDGMLLAADVTALRQANARFDERFDFHFYDLDFCRTARSLGLHLGTWPLEVIHESAGQLGSASWNEGYMKYLGKWLSGRSA